MRRAILCFVAVIGAWSLVDFLRALVGMPLAILLGSSLPALAFALAVVRVEPRREPLALLILTFLWGAAVAPFVSQHLNDLLLGWLATLLDEARAVVLTPVIVAPVVEEAAKAAALMMLVLVCRRALDGSLDGLVYGAMVGLGFVMTENFTYLTLAAVQGGQGGLERAIYTRAILGGFKHAAFTATTGAAVGAAVGARTRKVRVGLVAAGLVGAILQHAAWNAFASRAITVLLCDSESPAGPCRVPPEARRLYLDIPLVVAIYLGPGVATLAAITIAARRSRATRPAPPS